MAPAPLSLTDKTLLVFFSILPVAAVAIAVVCVVVNAGRM